MTTYLSFNDRTTADYVKLVNNSTGLNLVLDGVTKAFLPHEHYLLSGIATSVATSDDLAAHVKAGRLEIVEALTANVTVATAATVTPPVIKYTAFAAPKIIDATVGATGWAVTVVSGTPVYYSVSPALPNALSLNTSTGLISGTPTGATAAAADYTITATAKTAHSTTKIRLTVNDATP